MSESELLEVFYLATADADAQFETWMAVTIAVVISVYSAAGKLNSALKVSLTLLYVCMCLLLYTRYLDAINNLTILIQQLHDVGSSYESGSPVYLPILRGIVVIGASILTIVMILRPQTFTEIAQENDRS